MQGQKSTKLTKEKKQTLSREKEWEGKEKKKENKKKRN